MKWRIQCCNEWCAGYSEYCAEKPKPIPCPKCGWIMDEDNKGIVVLETDKILHNEATNRLQ